MSYNPAIIPFSDPGLPLYNGIVQLLATYPADATMLEYKATLDANPNGLDYPTLVGLFGLVSARAGVLGENGFASDVVLVADLSVAGDVTMAVDASIGRDLEVIRDASIGRNLAVAGTTNLGGVVTAPGIATGTFVQGRPVLYQNPSTKVIYAAIPDINPSVSVHIASRTDGVDGSGTETDPYDGSTAAKLTAIWAALPSTNAYIKFGPGTFLFNTTLVNREGYSIEGSGIGVTILKWANGTSVAGSSHTLIGDSQTYFTNFAIRNLTIDCNLSNQTLCAQVSSAQAEYNGTTTVTATSGATDWSAVAAGDYLYPSTGGQFLIASKVAPFAGNGNKWQVIVTVATGTASALASQIYHGGNIGPLAVYTKNFLAENLDIIGGFASPGEGFFVRHLFQTSETSVSSPARAIFRNVHIRDTQGYASNLCSFGDNINSLTTNFGTCEFDMCSVINSMTLDGSAPGGSAFGGGPTLSRSTNCYAYNVSNGFNFDTGRASDVLVENCTFENVNNYGLLLNGNNAGQYGRITVRDTRISCIGEAQAWQIAMIDPDAVLIENCFIGHTTGTIADGTDYYIGNFGATPRVVCRDCIFPAGAWSGVLPYSTGTDVQFINNRTTAGAPSLITGNVHAIAEATFSRTIAATNFGSVYIGTIAAAGVIVEVDFTVKTSTAATAARFVLAWKDLSNYILQQTAGPPVPVTPLYYNSTGGPLYLGFDFLGSAGTLVARIRALGALSSVASPPAFGIASALTVNPGFPVNPSGADFGYDKNWIPITTAAWALGGTSNRWTGLFIDRTLTAGGTTGAQTINKYAGRVNFAASTQTLVVTNGLVSASSIILCSVGAADATAAGIDSVTPASGSFTIKLRAPTTAETPVSFLVLN